MINIFYNTTVEEDITRNLLPTTHKHTVKYFMYARGDKLNSRTEPVFFTRVEMSLQKWFYIPDGFIHEIIITCIYILIII